MGGFCGGMIDQPIKTVLQCGRDITKRVESFLCRLEAPGQCCRTNAAGQIRAVDGMDVCEGLAALIRKLIARVSKVGVIEPSLGDAFSRNEPHQKCLADGVMLVEYTINRGYGDGGFAGKLDDLSLVN